MDHCNLHLYRDGADMIIVIKNADVDVENTLTGLLSLLINKSVTTTSVPALDEPVQETVEKPVIDPVEEIFPDFLRDDVGSCEMPKIPARNSKTEKNESIQTHNFTEAKIKAMKIGEMEHFLFSMSEIHEQCRDILNSRLNEKMYSDIFAFVRFEKETEVRKLCLECLRHIGD